jgi:hypothetical protein
VSKPLAPLWIKSGFCDSTTCVEVAAVDGEIMIRDSANPAGPVLQVSRQDWDVFAAGVARGDFKLD